MDKEEVGKRIRWQRGNLALTREQFAEQINISPQFLAEIENGKKGMSAETLYKICEKANASADYILLGRQISNIETPAAKTLSKIPAKYSGQIEDILSAFLRAVEKAEKQ